MAESPLLYYITDRKAFAPDEATRQKSLLEKIREAARAEVDYIQLREKDLPTRALESLSREAMSVLKQARAEHPQVKTKLLINSRIDVALAAGADGVHLRGDDIAPRDVIAIWASTPETRSDAAHGDAGQPMAAVPTLVQPAVGVSCHSPEEVKQAEANGATFAVFAPVFEKKDAPSTKPTGLAQLREACNARIPVLALGGVALDNAKSCLDVGAAGIAAIRLFQENDVAKIVDEISRFIP